MRRGSVVVLSGGQDSTTCLYWARKHFEGDLYAITFDYKQRHSQEIEAAKEIAAQRYPGVIEHRIVDLSSYGSLATSSLTANTEIRESGGGHDGTLPTTFVPGRNLLFLTIAAAWAAVLNIGHVVTGVCQTDYSGYPDCRADTIGALTTALRLGIYGGDSGDRRLEIETPLMFKTKAETVHMAHAMPGCWKALARTVTCYNGQRPGCGECPACVLRAKGFTEAGYKDPAVEM